jgi:ABC-type lipoprotein export system ATPase subunit
VLRELEEIEMSDELHVQVDTAETGQAHWTDVTEASPGQRATALLELALIAGDAPLVIDQPEDDLDNRFIYDEVVQKMAEVASRRQLIVATHNANIPVLGDAELILALEASSDQSRELANGGLDEREVAETARKILEGGEEAFAARAQRYAPPA